MIEEATGELSEKIVDEPGSCEPELCKSIHKTLKKVREDTEALRFNTAISQMMIFVNDATQAERLPRETLLQFVQALAPYAAHLAEELWSRLGGEGLVALSTWPEHDEALCVEDTVTLVVQVNGKLRSRLEMPRGTSQADLEAAALADERIQNFLGGKEPRRVIVVPDRLVNIVI